MRNNLSNRCWQVGQVAIVPPYREHPTTSQTPTTSWGYCSRHSSTRSQAIATTPSTGVNPLRS